MRTKSISYPEAYLAMRNGRSARIANWKDKSIILVPEKKLFVGQVDHPLVKKYLIGLDSHEAGVTVAERFQLVYAPHDAKTICSDGIMGPHLIDHYQISASDMSRLDWVIYDFV